MQFLVSHISNSKLWLIQYSGYRRKNYCIAYVKNRRKILTPLEMRFCWFWYSFVIISINRRHEFFLKEVSTIQYHCTSFQQCLCVIHTSPIRDSNTHALALYDSSNHTLNIGCHAKNHIAMLFSYNRTILKL